MVKGITQQCDDRPLGQSDGTQGTLAHAGAMLCFITMCTTKSDLVFAGDTGRYQEQMRLALKSGLMQELERDEEDEAEAAAAAAANVSQTEGEAGEESDEAGLKPQDIDAYWLQREIGKAFGSQDAAQSQKLANEVFAILKVCCTVTQGGHMLHALP